MEEAPKHSLCYCHPVRQMIYVDVWPNAPRVEKLDKLLIHGPRLGVGESPVFIKDGGVGPSLQFSEASDQTSRSMLAFVAVNEQR